MLNIGVLNKYKKWATQKYFVGVFIFFISVLLGSLFSSYQASAATINLSPEDQIKSYSNYNALTQCTRMGQWQTSISTKNASTPSTWLGTDTISVGYIVDPDDGLRQCNNIIKSALDMWGYSGKYTEALKAFGYTKLELPNCTGIGSTQTCGDNTTSWVRPSDEGDLLRSFQKTIKDNVYGGDTPTLEGKPELLYLRAQTHLEKASACNASPYKKVSDLTADEKKQYTNNDAATTSSNAIGAKDYLIVKLVNGTSWKTEDWVYKLPQDNWAKTIKLNEAPSGGSVEWTCVKIAKDMAGYANRVAQDAASMIALNQDPNSKYAGIIVTPGVAGTIGDSSGGEASGEDPNASSCGIEGVGWILCPVINFLAAVADQSFNFLADNFLRTDPNVFNTDNGTYQAWAIMRNIANILFVIAFLFIVFSQLTGVGISNYGVKKMLPRIVVAAILVNVSYFISQLAIDLSNILGYSIQDVFNGVIAQVNTAEGAGKDTNVLTEAFTTGNGTFVALAGMILGGVVAVGAIYLLLSAFGPILLAAVLALVLILFILVARQAIVILLVILSPLAFVAFLLPNTESLFKQWRKILTAMLMLFPIIALVFGASALASNLLGASFTQIDDGSSNVFGQVIASAVLVLPLFVVPVLLKKSLDAVPAIGKMANKWASRGYSGVGGKLREGNRNSYIGKGNAIRKQQRQVYTDRKFAENVSKGGVRSLAAKGFGVTGKGRYARNAVGRIADEASEKAFESDISAMAVSLRSTHNNPDTQIDDIASELTSAIQSGDKVKARAAQSILRNSGGAGLDTLHRTLQAASEADPNMRGSEVGVSLRTDLNNAGLKGKDNTLATWAYSDNTFEAIGNGTATTEVRNPDGSTTIKSVSAIQGLNSVELAGQRGHVIEAGKHLITPDQAKAVLADNVSKDMDPKKKALFEEISRGVHFPGGPVPPTGGSSGPTGGPSTPTGSSGSGGTGGGTSGGGSTSGSATSSGGSSAGTAGSGSSSRPAPTTPSAPVDPEWQDWHRQQKSAQTVINVDHTGSSSAGVLPKPQTARESQEEAKAAIIARARRQAASAGQQASHTINSSGAQTPPTAPDDYHDRMSK